MTTTDGRPPGIASRSDAHPQEHGSPVVRAEDLKFSEEGIKEVLRGVMLPIWNAYSFFTTYANVDCWEPPKGELKAPENPANPLDRWILSKLQALIKEVTAAYDDYEPTKAARAIYPESSINEMKA